LAEEAIALDPDYAMAYTALARTHIVDVWLRSTKSPEESYGVAIDLAKKALSLDESSADAHDILGNILILRKDYENGIAQLENALELEPNGADIHAHLGLALYLADRSQEAVQVLEAVRKQGLESLDLNQELVSLHTNLGNEAAARAVRQRIDRLAHD